MFSLCSASAMLQINVCRNGFHRKQRETLGSRADGSFGSRASHLATCSSKPYVGRLCTCSRSFGRAARVEQRETQHCLSPTAETSQTPQGFSSRCTASNPAELIAFLSSFEGVDVSPHQGEIDSCLELASKHINAFSTTDLATLAWTLSEIGHQPQQTWLAVFYPVVEEQLDSFFASDLCSLVCAVGLFDSKPSANWLRKVITEVEYHLKEYVNDFSAYDIARYLTGLGDLGVSGNDGFQELVQKAIYLKVKTIQERAAVDYALTRFDSGLKTSVYNTKWTFEEIHWLPRHERDKKRIVKENWEKTQWQGWS